MTTENLKGPARLLPLLYLGTAHVSLALACLFAALWPQAVAGFFYHPWLVALVHLVTLGWITFSIVGAIYIAGPLALRMEMPGRRADYVAYAFAGIGLIGMVGHLWIEEYPGMAWSAACVAGAVGFMTVRFAGAVRRSTMPRPVKTHLLLACANFWIAASMGLLVAYDKVAHVLPGFVLSNVFAHAHLAAVGWATMMVVGVGYRLLPMTLSATMPSGRSTYVSAILLEVGVLGLFVALLCRSEWAIGFGIAIVAGLAVFAAHVGWMVQHPARRPPGARWPDFGVLHAGSAALCLAAAAAIGLGLLLVPASPLTLHLAAVYGVLGLVGFLAQMVIAMEARLLPMATLPSSPHVMREPFLQAVVFGGWSIGVPALAAGFFLESARLVGLGAWALLAAVVIAALDNAFVIAADRPLVTELAP